MESWPQISNEKVHRPLDFLTKVSTRSNKGEENNKLTLGQQRQRVTSRKGKKMSNSQTRRDQSLENRVLKANTKMDWEYETLSKCQNQKNSFRRWKFWRISHKNGAALWCKGHQSIPTLCVRPPGSVNTLIERVGEKSTSKVQKNAQKLKTSSRLNKSGWSWWNKEAVKQI